MCRVSLPGGRDLEHPSSLCAGAECLRWWAGVALQLPPGRYVRITSDIAAKGYQGIL
jgi:hypothetical protein